MITDEFDGLSEQDKTRIHKLVFNDLIISSLLIFQYIFMLFVVMFICSMVASVAALTHFAHIALAAILTISVFLFAKKHMDDRRKTLNSQVQNIIKSNKN